MWIIGSSLARLSRGRSPCIENIKKGFGVDDLYLTVCDNVKQISVFADHIPRTTRHCRRNEDVVGRISRNARNIGERHHSGGTESFEHQRQHSRCRAAVFLGELGSPEHVPVFDNDGRRNDELVSIGIVKNQPASPTRGTDQSTNTVSNITLTVGGGVARTVPRQSRRRCRHALPLPKCHALESLVSRARSPCTDRATRVNQRFYHCRVSG